ncbi:MAG: flagellin [Verrucomicrobia bacterium]|nr:MAG: flagellin [Verrucomicrobiota bacterium]
MSVVINTNTAATVANNNLSASNAMLQRSLNRLSSGLKIVQPSDDAGGLAVSMKLEAAMKRTDAVSTNVANAISFLQTQDGGLKTAGKVLNRISELKTLSEDVTKSTSDKANYQVEFAALQSQLTSLVAEKFNGVDLFGGGSLTVATSEDGAQTFDITQADLAGNVTDVTGAADLTALAIADVTGALENVATSRAQNGAESSRLNFSADLLVNNRTNLEAANSRIIDVDVAQESTQLARYSILVQAGTAMLAQANASSQVALRLLS